MKLEQNNQNLNKINNYSKLNFNIAPDNKSKKTGSIIGIIIVIIIGIIVLIGLTLLNSHKGTLIDLAPMSEEQIIALIKKGIEQDNFSYTLQSIYKENGVTHKLKSKVYKKDDIVVAEVSSNIGNIYARRDPFFEETTYINKNENTVSVGNISSQVLVENGFEYFIGSYLDTEIFNLKFERGERIDNKDVAIITISDKNTMDADTREYIVYDKVAIDLKTGLIVKSYLYNTTYKYTFNNVKYTDIEEPDISKYKKQ